MNPITPHLHTGTDSPKLVFQDAIENAPQATIADVSGTAGATYSATEQTLINDLKGTVNDLLTKLQNIGIIK
jgi:hypothetical protein